jgi:hypothetical protein
MGLFKIIGIAAGLPLRPTTTRERSRRYQREANDLLEQQLHAIQNQAQPRNVTQVRQVPSDTRPRRACPECLEMMLVGASTCPHCRTTGITSTEDAPTSVEAKQQETFVECPHPGCGGSLALDGGDEVLEDCLWCDTCGDCFEKEDYPHLY